MLWQSGCRREKPRFCGISFPEPSRAVVTAKVKLPGMFPGFWVVGSAVRHADAVPVWRV